VRRGEAGSPEGLFGSRVVAKNVFRRKEPVEVPVNSLVNKLEAVDKNS